MNLQLLHKAREGLLERLEVTMKEGNLNGHCPGPQNPHRPPKAETGEGEVTPRDIQRQDESPTEQRYPTPRQQLLEADKKRKKRLAALARDQIMKLREE